MVITTQRNKQGLQFDAIVLYSILGCGLSIASIIADHHSIGMAKYLLNAAYILAAILGGNRVSLIYVAIALPNTKCLTLVGASDAVIICFVSVVFRILSEKKVPKNVFLMAGLHVLFGLTIVMRYDSITYGIVFPIKMMSVLMFYYYNATDLRMDHSRVELKRFCSIWGISYGLGIIAALGTSVVVLADSGRLNVAKNDPNMLAVEAVFVLAYIMVIYFEENSISNLMFYILVALMSGVCLLSGSRMGIILLAGTVVFTVCVKLKHIRKTMPLLFLLLICGLFFVYSSFGNSMIDTLLARSASMVERGDISNGRFEIWREYIDVLNKNPICWLLGMGDFSFEGLTMQAHNVLLEDLSAYGIIGMLTVYPLYILIICSIKQGLQGGVQRKGRRNIFLWLPFLVPIVGSVVLHSLTNVINTTMLLMGALLPYLYSKKDC